MYINIIRTIEFAIGILQKEEIATIFSLRKDEFEESVLLVSRSDGMYYLATKDIISDNDRLSFAEVLSIDLCLNARSEMTTSGGSCGVRIVVIRMHGDSTRTLGTQSSLSNSLDSECVGTCWETHINLHTRIYQLLVKIPVDGGVCRWSDSHRVVKRCIWIQQIIGKCTRTRFVVRGQDDRSVIGRLGVKWRFWLTSCEDSCSCHSNKQQYIFRFHN